MALSMELRRKVLTAVDRGESRASVARRLEISDRTVRRLIQRREQTGDVHPDKTGPKGPMKLTRADEQRMREQVAAKPGVTARQLMAILGVEVVESTVCRALKRLGLSLKKSH